MPNPSEQRSKCGDTCGNGREITENRGGFVVYWQHACQPIGHMDELPQQPFACFYRLGTKKGLKKFLAVLQVILHLQFLPLGSFKLQAGCCVYASTWRMHSLKLALSKAYPCAHANLRKGCKFSDAEPGVLRLLCFQGRTWMLRYASWVSLFVKPVLC